MTNALVSYSAAKSQLGTFLGASEDLLHVHAGLIIFFVSALLFRRRMRSPVPMALVWVFALANEAIDVFSPVSSTSRWENLMDIVNTVFWPTLLFLLARRRVKAGDPNQTA